MRNSAHDSKHIDTPVKFSLDFVDVQGIRPRVIDANGNITCLTHEKEV